MKLEELLVKNYRTLEDVKVNFSGYYTAISGQNNAGKTTLMKVIRSVFRDNSRERFYWRGRGDVNYEEDKTQWIQGNPDITFQYKCTISKDSDQGLFLFIEKFNEEPIGNDFATLEIKISHKKDGEFECIVSVGPKELSSYNSKQIYQKFVSSTLAFMHDSASSNSPIFGSRGQFLHELTFSPDELKQIADEQRKMQNKIKSISKTHRSELSTLLGHLQEKYEVEFSIPDGMFSGNLPFEINLKDKNVDVPLSEWGSGTQNRTQIMMSILQANRIKSTPDENKITPMVLIEEPESFLHPSAQAEFGRVLRDLANELKIQTIVTTHSPYMLSQENISSNILLARKAHYGRVKETQLVELKDESWMEPFSEILGLDNSEFASWKKVLTSEKSCVMLVEGEIDKKYYEHINSLNIQTLQLPDGIEIVPYEGKDALKNTILLKFIIQKFKKVFVTFDLDAKLELERTMHQIGLIEGTQYMAIGANKPGRQCIEGLLPEKILAKVHGENTDLIMQLSSAEAKDRKSAKSLIKQKLLAEFKGSKDLSAEDLKAFNPIFKALAKNLG
jgi:putative ATP-dependent endonuclease of the OLD family